MGTIWRRFVRRVLEVLSPLGDVHIDPRGHRRSGTVGEIDIVLVTTKLYDVATATAAIAPMIGRSPP